MANFNYNKIFIGGRLTETPQLGYTNGNQPVEHCKFTVAVNRYSARDGGDGKKETDFINCVAWRKTAEFITKYFSKGSSIFLSGSLQNRQWTDNNNVKRYATEIIVDDVNFVDSRSDDRNSQPERSAGATAGYNPQDYNPPTNTIQGSINTPDDDLPF